MVINPGAGPSPRQILREDATCCCLQRAGGGKKHCLGVMVAEKSPCLSVILFAAGQHLIVFYLPKDLIPIGLQQEEPANLFSLCTKSTAQLTLQCSRFTYPKAFRNLSSLTRLSLEGNHIEAIGRDSLKDLETLHDLNLRKNHIWIIQNGAFTKLLRLSMLNLGHNFIADLPNQLFDGLIQLKTMHLEANRITAVNCTFRHLLNLRNLYLNNNQISSISDSAFSYLNKLHFLHLSKNNLSSLPIHLFAELPKLKYVFLSHNPWKCDCRMRWFWQGTTKHRGVIRGLHCDFLGPDNITVLDVPHPGDLADCTVPPELASEDKCRVVDTSVAPRPPAHPSKVILLALLCHAWYFPREWDTSVVTF
ncbi:uncharacterized protein LOC141964638 isoform X2 [Athene noctua]|uniref:uncharacterized protein LOC141964638 isoform X2 n=1 Tax=Athene noctua TaxID=126797 RepID=UPI003EBB9D22